MRHRTVLVFLLLTAACVPRYRVTYESDAFALQRVARMHDNVLEAAEGSRDWVALNAEVTRVVGDSAQYAFRLEYRSTDGWLNVRRGPSLLLLADSERIALTGVRGERRRGYWGTAETMRYPVSRALLDKLTSSDTVRVRVIGNRYYVDRSLGESNRVRLRRFLETADSVQLRIRAQAPASAT